MAGGVRLLRGPDRPAGTHAALSTLFIVLSPNKNPVAQHIGVHAWHPPPHAALRTPDPRP